MALKLLCVLGTRPEAIKLAPVLKALHARPEQFSCCVCVTGQHRELLQPALRLFHICPDYDLKLMQPGQSLQHVAAGVVQGLEPILAREKPDWVLVQGDTTTTLAAALAATYAHVPVAHVEAGLRSGNLRQPFPEEINRRLTDQLARLHFAPTETARQNLLAEGIPPTRIFVTGNTVVDALREVAAHPFDFARSPLATLLLDSRRLVLVTAHRRKSFGPPQDHQGGGGDCLSSGSLASQKGIPDKRPQDYNVYEGGFINGAPRTYVHNCRQQGGAGLVG